MGILGHARDRYLADGVSVNSYRAYQSGFNRFQKFCCLYGFQPCPPQEQNLELFVTHLARAGLVYNSIKVYLYGIQFCALQKGFVIKICNMRRLYYVCRGIRRTESPSRKTRNPITTKHLKTMIKFIDSSLFSPYDKALWKSLILTAFFGLLRVSEFTTANPRTYDPLTELCLSDIRLVGPKLVVRIKASKTDPFRVGADVTLWETGCPLCPVNAFRLFCSLRGKFPQGPLYTQASGEFVTRKRVAALLDISLRDVNINTHSFRIGGASAAAAAGVPDSVIQAMGRWRSDCYKRYIRMDDTIKRNWSSAISKVKDVNAIWRFDGC